MCYGANCGLVEISGNHVQRSKPDDYAICFAQLRSYSRYIVVMVLVLDPQVGLSSIVLLVSFRMSIHFPEGN